MQLREVDERVTDLQQLQADDGPVVLINQFNVVPEDARSPEFQARVVNYPDSAIAAPHVFQKVAVPGICVA